MKENRIKLVDYPGDEFQLRDAAAFVQDAETAGRIKQCISGLQFENFEVTRGDVRTAVRKYREAASPSLLIVDISNSELPFSDLEELANVCAPEVKVVVVGSENTVGIYRDLLGYGVSDYLVKPLPQDLLHQTLVRIQTPWKGSKVSSKTGKTVGVFGASGGVGASSIICNLADVLSTRMRRRIMLVDLNLQQGDVALLLGKDGGNGLTELLANPERVDDLFIERSSSSVNPRLDILTAEGDWRAAKQVSSNAVEIVMGYLRRHYHFVLLDLMRGYALDGLHLLSQTDTRIIVTEPSLSALRNTRQILNNLNSGSAEKQNLVVLNFTRPSLKMDVGIRRVEEFIGQPVDVCIPYEGDRFAKASLEAIPVCRGRGKAARALIRLSENLAGTVYHNNTRSILSYLGIRG